MPVIALAHTGRFSCLVSFTPTPIFPVDWQEIWPDPAAPVAGLVLTHISESCGLVGKMPKSLPQACPQSWLLCMLAGAVVYPSLSNILSNSGAPISAVA